LTDVATRRLTPLQWLERALWLLVVGVVLTRCVLPSPGEAPGAALERVRVATDGRPVLVVFDGSR
jgi:hypothetical protein